MDVESLALPADVQAELDAMTTGGEPTASEEDISRLDQIGLALLSKRSKAVQHRLNSGIEEVWCKAEEAYIGIDDANRGEFVNAKWAKPMTMDGPVTTSAAHKNQGEEVRSTAFVRLTARYVDAGTAKLGEILLPPDDKAFSLKPTPNPDLILAKDDERQLAKPDGTLLERDATPEEQAQMQAAQPPASPPMGAPSPGLTPPGQAGPPSAPGTSAPAIDPATGQPAPQGLPPGVPLTVKDLATEKLEQADEAAEKAETRIYDWMVESKYTAEARKVIHDAARLGVGVLKGPFPTFKRGIALTKGPNGEIQVQINGKIIPGFKRIDPWHFFPDPACGENVRFGDYTFERDFLSARQLRDLKKEKGYLPEQIDKVLLEGPGKKYQTQDRPNMPDVEERFEVWFYYGMLDREDMLAINAKQMKGVDEKTTEVYCICTMVNDSVIKGVLNPLESGSFPYHAMPWQPRSGCWAGIGIPEQGATPQRMVNAATRAMLNNAGKSGGAQIVMHQSVIPADGDRRLTGGDKLWFMGPDLDDVRKAFASFEFPNQTERYMAIIVYAERLFEESTNIPLITQGQSGPTTPDTFGATQLQDNNANQLLRSIGYAYDDYVTEPVVTQCYEWLLLDPDVPNEEKGDFQIDARGSSALVERHIQEQTIGQMGSVVKDPAFALDPRKWIEEFLRTKRLSYRKFKRNEQEQEKIDQTPPPPPPQVQAAQIRAQVDLQKAKIDTDRDTAYVQAEHAKVEADHDLRSRELEMKIQLAMLEYSNQRGIALEQVKADLAQTAMKLKVQKDLSAASSALDLHKHSTPQAETPPTEPAGRAPVGEAFQK